jgi:hypothetical protein
VISAYPQTESYLQKKRLEIRKSTLALLPVYLLFLWYLFFTGFVETIPLYGVGDDILLLGLLLVVLTRIALRPDRIRIYPMAILAVGIIGGIIVSSALLTTGPLRIVLSFSFLIFRPLILLAYLIVLDVKVARLFQWIVTTAWVLVLYNLPAITYNLIRYNVSILQAAYNDVIVGFPPFGNNDALVGLYTILLCVAAHQIFFVGNGRSIPILVGTYALVLTTMSFKYAIFVTAALAILILIRSRHKVRNLLFFGAVALVAALALFPVIWPRVLRTNTSPVYIAAELLAKGMVQEFSPWVGTGPGNYASRLALDSQAPLAAKYGLLELRNYWENVYQGPTGTMTNFGSSALALVGDVGLLAAIVYVGFLLHLLWQNFRWAPRSTLCLVAFVMGLYAIALGIFLDTWFWGLEIYMFMLGAKQVWDFKRRRRSDPRNVQVVAQG